MNAQRFPAAAGGNPDFFPGTITRTRGFISVASDQGAALEVQVGALGMAIVTEAAATAGGAALPDPAASAASGFWFVWVPFAQKNLNLDGTSSVIYQFDSKAMRKIEPGEVIVVMVVNSSATLGLEFIINFRLLMKLH